MASLKVEIGEEVYTSMDEFEKFIGFDKDFSKKEISKDFFVYRLGGRLIGYYDADSGYANLYSL